MTRWVMASRYCSYVISEPLYDTNTDVYIYHAMVLV
jgi:hypothetical protein